MSDAERTLFVGGLTDKTTEELLYELFLQAGPLEKVAIAKEKDGRKKKFGFVTFVHEDSVPYSVRVMEGIQLHGQPLRIQPRTGSSHVSPYASPQYSDHQDTPTPPYHRSQSWQQSPSRQVDSAPFRSPQYQTGYRQPEYRDRSQNRDRSSSRDRSEMGNNRSDTRSRHDYSDHRDDRSNDNRTHLHKSHTWHANDMASTAGINRGRSESQEMDGSSNQDCGQIMLSGGYPGGPQFMPERQDPVSLELRRQRLLSQQGHSLNAHRQHSNDRHDRNMQPHQYSQRRRY